MFLILIIKIDDNKTSRVKIFGEEFVKNNKSNVKIFYENKEIELTSFLDLDLSNYKTKKNILEIKAKIINRITNISYMFSKCSQLLTVNFESFENIENITDMSFMFSNCLSLSSISNISYLNTSNVKNMSSLFKGCNLLLELPDISKWCTSNANNMTNMFFGCKKLLSLPDISKWDTSKVESMEGMFQGCFSLSNLPELSKWDISNVISTKNMFYGYESLSSLPDLSLWNTRKIIDMSYMFYNCCSLKSLPELSKWKFDDLKNYKYMFEGCTLLTNFPNFYKNENINSINSINSPFSREPIRARTKTSYFKKKNKIIQYEIYHNNFFLCCPKCQNIPKVLLTDKEHILLSCINCGNGLDESIEKIINGSSKWIKKLDYYCKKKHNYKIHANNYCENCKSLLCDDCLKSHDIESEEKHKLIEIKDLYYNFCEKHNNILLYYCQNCNNEICKECKGAHIGHEIVPDYETPKILNSNIIIELSEQVKKMNIYQIAQESIEVLLEYFSMDKSLKFNETKNAIMNLAHNDIKIKHNLLLLAKILYYSSHKIKNKRAELIDIYIEVFNVLKDIFGVEEIEKFKEIINNYKNNFIASSKELTANDQKEINEYIQNSFKPISFDFTNSETKKNYFESKITISEKLKTYIVNESIKNPDNFINIDETINDIDNIHNDMNSEENPEFILSILGKCISDFGTQVYISKSKDKKFNDIELASIQSFVSLGKEKKYQIHFDFGEEKNQKILNDALEKENFLQFWKEEIAKELNISKKNIIFTNVHHGSVCVDAMIVNESTEDKSLILVLEKNKNIKKIEEKPILEALQISPDILDSDGDRHDGWGKNEKRGGEDYIPPTDGWSGIGLKVKNKYDNGDNTWLDYRNKPGEFAIAYLGINNFLNEKDIIIEDINNITTSLDKSSASYINERIYKDEEDIRNTNVIKASKCGEGICVFQNPKYAENYSGIIDLYGYRLKIMLMCRVNPKKIRQPKNFPQCWILNPTSEEVRPYRILIKLLENSPLTFAAKNKIILSASPVQYIISAIKTDDNDSFYNLQEDKRFEKIIKINKQKVPTEFFPIRLYSSNYYSFINEYLRNEMITQKKIVNGTELIGFSEQEIKSWVHCLHLALRKNKNVGNNTIVYRGISKYRFPSEIGIGSKFYIREFVSTSLKRSIAEQFLNYNNKNVGGTLMTITIKNNGIDGHPNYCYYIKGLSCYQKEEEILISSHCYYTVTNIERTNNFDYANIICEGFLFN